MALTVGEVEVIARIRDEFSNQLGQFSAMLDRVGLGLANMAPTAMATATAVGAVTAAALAAAAALKAIIERGSEFERVEHAFRSLAGGAEASTDTLEGMRAASQGLIKDYDLMLQANRAILFDLGLTDEQMATLTETALTLGRAMGIGPAKALSDLTLALGRESPRILDNLGIILKVGDANEIYARKVGKSVTALTDQEKHLAFAEEAMRRAQERVDQMGGLSLTTADRFDVMTASIGNIIDRTTQWISKTTLIEGSVTAWADAMVLLESIMKHATWDKPMGGLSEGFKKTSMHLDDLMPKVRTMDDHMKHFAADTLPALSTNHKELESRLKAGEEKVLENIKAWERYNEELKGFSSSRVVERGNEIVRMLGDLGGPLKVTPDRLSAMAKELQAAAQGALALKNTGLAGQFKLLADSLDPMVQFQQRWNVQINDFAIPAAHDFNEELQQQLSHYEEQADAITFGLLPAVTKLQEKWVGLARTVLENRPFDPKSMPDTFGVEDVFNNVAQNIARAIMGGGDVIKTIGATIGQNIMKGVVESFSKKFADSFLGKILSDILPGLGALLGPALEVAWSGLKKVFGIGVNDAVKKANVEIQKLRDTLLDTHGTLEMLELQANAVGLSFIENWGHQGAAGLQAFQALMADFEGRQARLQEAAERYGITWEEMGIKAREAHLSEIAQQLIEDFIILTQAGVGVDFTIEKMAVSINEFVQSALRTGTEVPEHMRPMLEKMIEMGLLTDAGGEKITSLEESGLQFSQTMTQGFDRVVGKIDELIQRLGGFIGQLHSIPEDIHTTIHTHYVDSQDGAEPVPFATGTLGQFGSFFHSFDPGGELALLHGNEAVVRKDQAAEFAEQFGGGDRGTSMSALLSEIQAMRRDLQVLPYAVRSQLAMGR